MIMYRPPDSYDFIIKQLIAISPLKDNACFKGEVMGMSTPMQSGALMIPTRASPHTQWR